MKITPFTFTPLLYVNVKYVKVNNYLPTVYNVSLSAIT